MQFKILEHTADLRIQVWGKTKEELFRNALQATFFAMKPEIGKSGSETRPVKVESLDLETLLVNFLSACLSLGEINQEIYEDIKFSRLNNHALVGNLIARKREAVGLQIKAVTFHNLKIVKNEKGNYTTTIIYDI